MTDTPAPIFLTSDQLEDMTGYRLHAGQIAWLRDNGYAFDVRKDGRPNVMLEQVRERQLKGEPARTVPRLAALDRLG